VDKKSNEGYFFFLPGALLREGLNKIGADIWWVKLKKS
jgi:hypothetical protein